MMLEEKAATGDAATAGTEIGAPSVYTVPDGRVQRRLAEIAYDARIERMVYEVTQLMFGLKPPVTGGAPEKPFNPHTAEAIRAVRMMRDTLEDWERAAEDLHHSTCATCGDPIRRGDRAVFCSICDGAICPTCDDPLGICAPCWNALSVESREAEETLR